MLQGRLPVRIRVHGVKMVAAGAMFSKFVRQQSSANHRSFHHCVSTGLIQSHRVKGGENADIGDYRGIVFTVTVAIRRNIYYQADME